MAKRGENRKARAARVHREARRKQLTTLGIALIGVMLVGGAAWLLWNRSQGGQAEIDYVASDISYDQPIQAVHEMESGPPIPFLSKSDPQPEIKINERFYDFGVIGSADIVTREFVIANTGDGPLTISRAYTTCGCTIADFTSTIIPAGMVSIVSLQLDAGFHDVRGQTVRRGLIIENNDPKRSSMEIWIQATVRN